jgi:hypothetical protein
LTFLQQQSLLSCGSYSDFPLAAILNFLVAATLTFLRHQSLPF